MVPFVQETVFLHHPGFRCQLPPSSRLDLFALDGTEDTTGLPGISDRLLESATPHQAVGPNQSDIIASLMARIGIVQRRQREAGSWVIDEDPLGEGDGWQDWPAFHRVATTERARIRFLVSPPGASATARAKIRQVAEHEYRIMARLQNGRLLRPKDMVENDLGVGLVYPLDEKYQRLDLYLADKAGQVPAKEQLSLLRQTAEAVSYAHRNRVVHRGLTPHAVLVRSLPDGGGPRVLVGDWQSAGAAAGTGLTGLSSVSASPSPGTQESQPPYPERKGATLLRPVALDVDRRMAEAFQAPEGVWNPDADRVRIDVFALGALAYYVLSGAMPAADRTTLRERLNRDRGLDLAVDLPQVTPALRALVLDATRPAVTERLPDVRAFLDRLEEAEAAAEPGEDVIDPLEAAPGAVIDGRFRLQRRLGTGSTAMGLLVNDLAIAESGPDSVRVLKVALDTQAGGRLTDEAKVLAELRHPRLVRLIEGPIDVGGRTALVLESAGDQTLGEVLRERERLSLDLLERWGTDLLEALVALDRAGVDHRDIKPANLGIREVREKREDRAKHLVLFDFSLSSAASTAVTAGTPPYLDPFLDSPRRGRFDSAAERYSAAVVLFEMATGSVPRFGDGLSDPASVQDEAAVEPGLFDPAVAESLTGFFRTALARDTRQRHDTAAEMLAAWQSVFQPVPRTVPDDAEDLAAKAEVSTPLARAGLSARALSAIEPLAVSTVGDLVAVDPVRLNHLSGVSTATRGEMKARAREWRNRFGAAVTGRGSGHAASARPGTTALPDPVTAAGLLVEHAGSARAESRRALARLLLGLDPRIDAFASQTEIAEATGVTRARVAQQVGALHDAWGADGSCTGAARHARRDRLAVAGRFRLRRHGGRAGAVGARDHAAGDRRGRRAPPWTVSRRDCCGSHLTGSRRCNVRKAMRGSSSPAAATAGSSCSPPTRRCSTRPRRSAVPPTISSPRRPPPASTPCPPRVPPGGCLMSGPRPCAAWSHHRRCRTRDGCCGWPPRWHGTPPWPAPATCTRGACRPPRRSASPWPASARSRSACTRSTRASAPSSPHSRRCRTGRGLTSSSTAPGSAWSTTRRNAPTGHAPARRAPSAWTPGPRRWWARSAGSSCPTARRGTGSPRARRPGRSSPSAWTGSAPTAPWTRSPAGSAPRSWT